ncbi:MAG: PVC-type heme-binding CxxCH protein, partial [Verrucomicrobiota bacterium]
MRVFLFLPAIVSSLLILASLGNEASSRQTGSKSAGGVGPGAEVARQRNEEDGKNRQSGLPEPEQDVSLAAFGIYADEAPLPEEAEPLETNLPLKLAPGTRIAFIGNTLFERAQDFAWFEAMLQQAHPDHRLVIRNFAWSADEVDLQPRPDNFATVFQHLTRERIDLIFAAYGFNESFAGESGLETFRDKLTNYIERLRTSAFNGESGPQIILVSPIGNEDLPDIPAATLNQENLAAYTNVMREVAEANKVGFADVFSVTSSALADPDSRMTINGVHLTEAGYEIFSRQLFSEVFSESAPDVGQDLRAVLVDKNRQYFRRYRPLNTFYYTGGRRKAYGYLDFLPAMRNFEILTENREERAHAIARGETDLGMIDDSNLPPLDEVSQGRGANEWLTPADQLDAFDIDPRFEVNCFASEEDFPDIACPIQMRWDGQGRMWVACSTTYPHVYPGQEPSDKMVILEDTDGDGKADESTVWADDLHIPLSFELTKNGIFVSEEPHFSLIEDTDGDGRADKRTRLLAGFGCEDSHHALHDFVWTPDGDLLFRESIFHNSQVETPYGPVRAKNSAWFQFTPRSQRLVSFGCYPNTNPWGVTFDKWGNHVASHPIFATSFHATNPPYPEQQPKAIGIPAYSGVCGQEFVDFDFWPEEMQGGYVKVRYKPTNRVEIHRWVRQEDHFTEEYVSDLIFSRNLSFIPVDLRYGPRGAMYVCDWYNPIKGHAQYSLRDPRRDRKSGRIWRIVPKGAELANPPQIAGASPEALLELLQRPEYRYRYWAKRELRQLDPSELGEV